MQASPTQEDQSQAAQGYLSGLRHGPSVKFVTEADGSVSQVVLTKSSGNKAVDDAYLEAVKKSSSRPLGPGCNQIETTATFIIDFAASN